jgi:hypothetical protein
MFDLHPCCLRCSSKARTARRSVSRASRTSFANEQETMLRAGSAMGQRFHGHLRECAHVLHLHGFRKISIFGEPHDKISGLFKSNPVPVASALRWCSS